MSNFFKNICFLIACVYTQIGFADAIIIGIAGGSGSGKTTIMDKIATSFPSDVVTISQDFYYKDLSHLSLEERAATNFDHPDSIDFDLLQQHLASLKRGEGIDVPEYDFVTHSRKGYHRLDSSKIIVIEGILLFAVVQVRDLCDYKLFVDTDADLRFIRRVNRDVKERGRTLESVSEQYLKTVYPMYLSFVEPSKRFADLIIPWNEYNSSALDLVVQSVESKLNR